MKNARSVHAACKVEYRSICRSFELTADVLFYCFSKLRYYNTSIDRLNFFFTTYLQCCRVVSSYSLWLSLGLIVIQKLPAIPLAGEGMAHNYTCCSSPLFCLCSTFFVDYAPLLLLLFVPVLIDTFIFAKLGHIMYKVLCILLRSPVSCSQQRWRRLGWVYTVFSTVLLLQIT